MQSGKDVKSLVANSPNRSKMYFALLNEAKQEHKHEIESLDAIFAHAEGLKAVLERLLEGKG